MNVQEMYEQAKGLPKDQLVELTHALLDLVDSPEELTESQQGILRSEYQGFLKNPEEGEDFFHVVVDLAK